MILCIDIYILQINMLKHWINVASLCIDTFSTSFSRCLFRIYNALTIFTSKVYDEYLFQTFLKLHHTFFKSMRHKRLKIEFLLFPYCLTYVEFPFFLLDKRNIL